MSDPNEKIQLLFPHKDCVLAPEEPAGQDARRETFYPADPAADEIRRLLSPKAFSGWMRYTASGRVREEQVSPYDNLVIKGDNLLSLCSIQQKYAGRVRMIYWDVPYNTGSDSFRYRDRLPRSTWLVFLKNRVEAALPMLSENGVFLIQCSFHQYPYLKVLLDEIIGHYVMTFHVLVRHPERTLTSDKEFNDVIEYILVYSKSSSFKMPKKTVVKTADEYRWTVTERTEGTPVEFDGRKGRVFLPGEYELKKAEASGEHFKIVTVRGSIREKVSSGRFYMKYLKPLEGVYPPKTLFKAEGIGDDMYDFRYFYLPPEGNKNGAYLQGMPTSSDVTYRPYPNFLDFVQSYNTVNKEGGVEFRNGKKPEDLLAFLMGIFTDEGDLVLDAFGGSGTTAAVALKMKRQFILCEQMDFVETVTVKRLCGVLREKEKALSEEQIGSASPSFVYLEIASFGQSCVNYRDIDDPALSVSDADKRATRRFYEGE